MSEAILIDPYLMEWSEEYHPFYYEALLIEAQNKYPSIEFGSIKEVLSHQAHKSSRLRCYEIGLEDASEIESETIDISISNACFEHFVYPELALKELARVTVKGGLGFHQIDLRDHRDFTKPLEFLTFSDKMYSRINKMTDACHGNRLRYNEYNEIFEKVGFEVSFKPNMFAEEIYLKSILNQAQPKYRHMPKEFVAALGGRFFIKKNNV